MALTYAILSVLADRSQSKDDVIKYFESSIGFLWIDWCDDSLSLVAILIARSTPQILVCNSN